MGLVALGRTDQEVGEAVGVTRQTVNVWRHHHPEFRAAVERARQATWAVAGDRLLSMLPTAAERLETALDGPDGWRVALALVKLSGLVHGDRTLKPTGETTASEVVRKRAIEVDQAILFRSTPLNTTTQAVVGNMLDRLIEVDQETDRETEGGH